MTHLGLDVALHGRVATRINDLRPSDAPVSLQHTRVGSRPGNAYELGERLKVRVVEVSLERREILVEE